MSDEDKLAEIEKALSEAERSGYKRGFHVGLHEGQRSAEVWRERCGVLVDRLRDA